jgi:hypothetical protein
MSVQVDIMPALCALHNFIRRHDPENIHDLLVDLELPSSEDTYGYGMPDRAARQWASARRDAIAHRMWQDYLLELAAS